MHTADFQEVGRGSAKGELGGVCFSRGTNRELYDVVCAWLRSATRSSRLITYVNPHVFNLARSNSTLQVLLRKADMIAVDGAGFALAVRWLTGHRQTRTVMTPLFDDVLATENLPELHAVLIGGVSEVLERGAAAINLASRRIKIVATCSGYATRAEHCDFLRAHRDVDIVMIAMGTPRSEELMLDAPELCAPKVLWNIGGGTLHFYAGTLKRVPERVSRLGMQWLWRIVHEPRIASRYLIGIPRFLATILRFRLQQTTQPEKVYGRAYR